MLHLRKPYAPRRWPILFGVLGHGRMAFFVGIYTGGEATRHILIVPGYASVLIEGVYILVAIELLLMNVIQKETIRWRN
jgi:hypothetical protein